MQPWVNTALVCTGKPKQKSICLALLRGLEVNPRSVRGVAGSDVTLARPTLSTGLASFS